MTKFGLALSVAAAISVSSAAHASEPLKAIYKRSESAANIAYMNGANGFGIEFLKAGYANDPSANRVYSPVGIATNLALLSNLVDSSTRAALQAKLGWKGLSLQEVNQSNRLLADSSVLQRRAYTVNLASSIWADNVIQISDTARKQVEEGFDGVFKSVNFKDKKTAGTINAWVKEKTKGTIEEVVKPSDIASSNAFIANTLYFEAKWRAAFLSTKDREFTTPEGVKTVPFMDADSELPMKIIRETTYDVVELPYAFGETVEAFGDRAHGQGTMMIVLPKEGTSLDQIVSQLNVDLYNGWVNKLSESETSWFDLSMPKWKLTFQDKNYVKNLSVLGVAHLMQNMRGESGQPLKMSAAGQKGFIEVGETGTKAGFVTFTGISVFSSIPPFSIDVNRPFIYIVRDAATKAILIAGVVTDPTKEK